ncbi:RHS repeat-associated core domain-containing protein [Pseudomonas monteilii]|uniref:RHS repeat-associated core domain-containing protein n=4 Tax=Pseudomonas TaxID=286 RepID=A0A6G6V5G3_9PSED|nr:RHS repeat-associated core domain-containing protein [Pseudomonas monteilii]QIG20974.1 RHS repeat-associated core domain-containing protein [Pseudomonas monteilii]QIG26224.1 RHS repeat-associated core domain-containing protein [Pseudomonas monteilii]
MTSTKVKTQMFYQNNHVFNTLHKDSTSLFLRCRTGPLAVLSSARPSPTLLAHDQNHSILTTHSTLETRNINYAPFGYTKSSERGIPAYAGELPDPLCESYLLGKGFRAFSPEINRFKSSDTVPPFEILNYYAYCEDDPINAVDPSGHYKTFRPGSSFDRIRLRYIQTSYSETNYTPSLLNNSRTQKSAKTSLVLMEEIKRQKGLYDYEFSRREQALRQIDEGKWGLRTIDDYGGGYYATRKDLKLKIQVGKSILKELKKRDTNGELRKIKSTIEDLLGHLNYHTSQLNLATLPIGKQSQVLEHISIVSAQIRASANTTEVISRNMGHTFVY